MKGRTKTSTQTLRRPSSQQPVSGRGIAVIVLTLLLPPVGLLLMWYRGCSAPGAAWCSPRWPPSR